MEQLSILKKQKNLNPYITSQLIAYIGNKRALLPFLYSVFSKINEKNKINVFLDPFAGTGSVSRLARYMGYKVYSNDWEFYSYILNYCYLMINHEDIFEIFSGDNINIKHKLVIIK